MVSFLLFQFMYMLNSLYCLNSMNTPEARSSTFPLSPRLPGAHLGALGNWNQCLRQ